MQDWKERLQKRAGIVAFAASAVVFAGLSLAKPRPAASNTAVPIVTRFVARGSRIHSGDVRWIAESTIRPVPRPQLRGYARVALYAGQVLSPQEVAPRSTHQLVVAVQPTNPVDARATALGEPVMIIVSGRQTIIWRSPPLTVISRSVTQGESASVNVVMSWAELLQFERDQDRGSISLVGLMP